MVGATDRASTVLWPCRSHPGFLFCTEKRQAEAQRIRDKYPDRIPVRLLSLAGLGEATQRRFADFALETAAGYCGEVGEERHPGH